MKRGLYFINIHGDIWHIFIKIKEFYNLSLQSVIYIYRFSKVTELVLYFNQCLWKSLLIVYKVNLLDNPHCPLFVNTWINGIPENFQSPTFEHLSQILIYYYSTYISIHTYNLYFYITMSFNYIFHWNKDNRLFIG